MDGSDTPEVPVRPEVAEAIGLVLKGWPLLQLAVQNEWGGPDSKEKADWLVGVIGQVLCGPKKMEVFDLEDILFDILSDEFSAVAEDGSVQQVSRILIRVRDELLAGDTRGLIELRTRYGTDSDAVAKALKSSAADTNAESSDDDDEGAGEWVDEDEAEGEAASSASQSADTPSRHAKPVPDEEGWTTIPTRRRR